MNRVVDKVHMHTYGHSIYSDIRRLLQRNILWSDDVQRYLADILQRCNACVSYCTLYLLKLALASIKDDWSLLVFGPASPISLH